MILTALQFCISNGSHNIANAISPLLNVFTYYNVDNDYAFYMGSVGMSMGLFIYGAKVLETVGKKVVILDFQKGFCV